MTINFSRHISLISRRFGSVAMDKTHLKDYNLSPFLQILSTINFLNQSQWIIQPVSRTFFFSHTWEYLSYVIAHSVYRAKRSYSALLIFLMSSFFLFLIFSNFVGFLKVFPTFSYGQNPIKLTLTLECDKPLHVLAFQNSIM